MIERLRVQILAGVMGKCSSSEVTLLTLIWRLLHPVLLQWHIKDPGKSDKKCWWQVTPKHSYTLDQTKSKWADYATVQALCGSLSGNEPTRNSVTVVSACWATVDWSWPKEWNQCGRADFHFKKNRRRGMNCRTFSQIPAPEEKTTTTTTSV